jgi:hypothetical protein
LANLNLPYIFNKHQIPSIKYQANSNVQNSKLKTGSFGPFEIEIWNYVENNSVIPSPLVGEGTGEGGPYDIHPRLHPPPSRGRIILANFYGSSLPAGRQG